MSVWRLTVLFIVSFLYLVFSIFFMVSYSYAQVNPLFNPGSDLISLHYDHAADRDDGISAAADRTVLQTLYGVDWIKSHTIRVNGTFGENDFWFQFESIPLMDVVWGSNSNSQLGGYISPSACPGLETSTQLSQTSPTPSLSRSA